MNRFSVMMLFAAWVLASSPVFADEALGRLFYTPEQRARMDVARQHERSVRIDEEESAPQSANILLNGVITRSDGKSTLWINNRIQSNELPAATVGKSGEVRVAAPGAQGTVRLKVGQSIDISSGVVEEVYRRMPPTPASGKETTSVNTMPGAEKLPMPPGRKDDAPIDIEGEIPSPR